MGVGPQHKLIVLAMTISILQRSLCLADAAKSIDGLYGLTFMEVCMKVIQDVGATGKKFIAMVENIGKRQAFPRNRVLFSEIRGMVLGYRTGRRRTRNRRPAS